jgi:hypothetical protein
LCGTVTVELGRKVTRELLACTASLAIQNFNTK